MGTQLDVDYNIVSRTGLHCAPKVHEQVLDTHKIGGTIRLSLGPFNNENDIDKTLQGVRDIAKTGIERSVKNKIIYEAYSK